jgi:hypothetical protein
MALKSTLGEGEQTCHASEATRLVHPHYPGHGHFDSGHGLDNTQPSPEHRGGFFFQNSARWNDLTGGNAHFFGSPVSVMDREYFAYRYYCICICIFVHAEKIPVNSSRLLVSDVGRNLRFSENRFVLAQFCRQTSCHLKSIPFKVAHYPAFLCTKSGFQSAKLNLARVRKHFLILTGSWNLSRLRRNSGSHRSIALATLVSYQGIALAIPKVLRNQMPLSGDGHRLSTFSAAC